MRLSHKDFDALQRATLELHEAREVEAFDTCLMRTLLKVIPTDMCSRVDVAMSPTTGAPLAVKWTDSSQRLNRALVDNMQRLLPTHPFSEYFIRSGDPTALKMSDFYNLSQFRRTELYEGYYRQLGVNRHLSLAVPGVGGTIIGINLAGRGKDFTERDRLILNLLLPHLTLANRNAGQATTRRLAPGKPLAAYELTPREMEVARWVAAGKSNPEIALILNANVRTIEKHLEKILEKLGVENRATAAVRLATANP